MYHSSWHSLTLSISRFIVSNRRTSANCELMILNYHRVRIFIAEYTDLIYNSSSLRTEAEISCASPTTNHRNMYLYTWKVLYVSLLISNAPPSVPPSTATTTPLPIQGTTQSFLSQSSHINIRNLCFLINYMAFHLQRLILTNIIQHTVRHLHILI